MEYNGRTIHTVAVGLSGGVDSSVAALLLQQLGVEVVGVHMKRFNTPQQGCSSDQDRQDAIRVAKSLDIPIHVVDFRDVYQQEVIDRFLKEFQLGRTPNPDVWCNEVMKFGLFLNYALDELGADAIATGHYARIIDVAVSESGSDSSDRSDHRLYKGVDCNKDQSYFLYRLTQYQLSKAIFPLGEIVKTEVRSIAKQHSLATADKSDSVGVCFIGDIDMQEYLRAHLSIQRGEVVDTSGVVIGHHEGVQLYTIGQRHGFTIEAYQGDPLYVVRKEVDTNRLVVGRDTESEVSSFRVGDIVWTGSKQETQGFSVRIRHLGECMSCDVVWGGDFNSLMCQLVTATRGVAAGQHAVFYRGDEVVGGGVIELDAIDPIAYNNAQVEP